MVEWLDDWMHGLVNMCVCWLFVSTGLGLRDINPRQRPLPIDLRAFRHARGPRGLLLTNNRYSNSARYASNHPSIQVDGRMVRPLTHKSIYPPIHSPTYPFTYTSTKPSIHSPSHLSTHIPIHPPTYIHPSTHPCIRTPANPPTHPSIHSPIHPSM